MECMDTGRLAEAMDDIGTGGYYSEFYKDLQEAVIDLLPPEKESYTDEDIQELKRIIPMYDYTRQDKDIIAEVVSIVTGKKWETGTIKGVCQNDWQNISYPTDEWSREAIGHFETEYFNMGTEWVFRDGEEHEQDAGGCTIYCHSWNTDGIKQEIADAAGVKPEDVVLYEFAGYKKVAQYREVV